MRGLLTEGLSTGRLIHTTCKHWGHYWQKTKTETRIPIVIWFWCPDSTEETFPFRQYSPDIVLRERRAFFGKDSGTKLFAKTARWAQFISCRKRKCWSHDWQWKLAVKRFIESTHQVLFHLRLGYVCQRIREHILPQWPDDLTTPSAAAVSVTTAWLRTVCVLDLLFQNPVRLGRCFGFSGWRNSQTMTG